MNKQASALIMALTVMIIISLGIAAVLQTTISYTNMKTIGLNKMAAQYLSEAGVVYGLWQCQNNNFASPVNLDVEKWRIVVTKTDKGAGRYEVSATVQYPN